MAPFPITARFVGDFVPHLVAVDTDDTWDQVAVKAAVHSVGRRVAEPDPHPGYEVLLGGQVQPADATLGEFMNGREFLPLQWVDVRFRTAAPSNV
ncbi:toluene-4-monooxygenase system B family protein [Mycobacterium sp. AT1]|uniref:toluene-4-monooxygenase system B family protein n=1 Tax=Mycobacterium sp. AT1 TaxID=1961706 RepID=UPI0009AE7C85|nr:toluene-4-monooxygenase system B family protein [Mycobacterium sp. AT1]OPX05313.1 isoprene monooxygenase hydroxylase, gamma subunit [Mycobacterium sp. AT1]